MARGLLMVVVVGMWATAVAKDRSKELFATLDALERGALSPAQVANRIAYSGTEAAATDLMSAALRKPMSAVLRGSYFEVLASIATPHPELLHTASSLAKISDDLTMRLNAIRVIGRMREVSTVGLLTSMLSDKLVGIRRETAKALSAIGSSKANPALLMAAKSEDDPETRAVMVIALGKLGDAKVAKALEPLLESSSESTRLAVAQALCSLGNRRGFDAARKLIASSDRYERLQGAMLFESAAVKVSRPFLTPLLADDEVSVRARAARILAVAGDSSAVQWLVVESFKSNVDQKLVYEAEIEHLRLSDDQRASMLKKAGLK